MCIDAGDPNQFDSDGSRRDIGAGIIYPEVNIVGDCNEDLEQNVLDILFIINSCILSTNINSNCECGDINNDDLINVLDIVNLVSIILRN